MIDIILPWLGLLGLIGVLGLSGFWVPDAGATWAFGVFGLGITGLPTLAYYFSA